MITYVIKKIRDAVWESYSFRWWNSNGKKRWKNVSNVACIILNKYLDLNLSPPDLLLAHWVGKPSDNSIDKIIIKIRVPHKYAKQTVMDACFALKSSTAKNLYINEELTKTRNSLYYRLRMKKKENPKSLLLRTWDGVILAKTSVTGKIYSITNEDELNSFLETTALKWFFISVRIWNYSRLPFSSLFISFWFIKNPLPFLLSTIIV